ncbi:hypothetical protein C817_04889 [Dorea sp. 5-2]|nr:hypothetical protein C817_04889 [Dorea sp. 5-2]
MGKQYSQKTLEERKQQMAEILQNLEDGVKEVFTSENYIKYLETFSKFHNYSFNNTILILAQCPQASFVASYKDWTEKFNRIVKRVLKESRFLSQRKKSFGRKKNVPDLTEVNIREKLKSENFILK